MAAPGDARVRRHHQAARMDEPQTWWARAFAAIYDASLWPGEHAGMKQQRRALLEQARGRVLEIGAGTGLNVPHYPEGLVELILTEPDSAMSRRLAQRASGGATVLAARADDLPVADSSVDTVVSTFVLCTVESPEAALREIRRVLRPGGQLLLIEHVRADARWLAALQRMLRRPWSSFARGCRCDQPTTELVRASGFEAQLRPARWRAMPPLVRPIVVGRAFRG
jgi:ubiquinone/menaquinone biosynthesis C-methylase UbiE